MTLRHSAEKMETGDITGFPRPAVTVDVLVFTIREDKLQVALIQRGIPPYQGQWALPGGFVRMEETLEEAAMREIEEETGINDVLLEQLYTFGEPNRDPRSRVITVAYYALVPGEEVTLLADTDAADASWFPVDALPPLAFDHTEIVAMGLERLRARLGYSNIAFGLLPVGFSLSELQKVYEIILATSLDKRNFRKRILALDLIEPTGQWSSGAHRPAQLYRWKTRKVATFK